MLLVVILSIIILYILCIKITPCVRAVQDMYKDSVTTIGTAIGVTASFKVEVGLHQGSALGPFLFVIIMDRLTDQQRTEAPWTML